MHLSLVLPWFHLAATADALAIRSSSRTAGVEALVQRRLPQLANRFEFSIVNETSTDNDSYVVSASGGKISVEGNTVSALLAGLHRYLSDAGNADIWWFIGNRLDQVSTLPAPHAPIKGASTVPYRYHFNTVTTSYTSAFWSWEDWELQLDWMALRGINLPLAWIGVEKIFVELFREIGLTDDEILDFISGPAFLAWNHFGNIQGSWGGDTPFSWVDDQFALQKKIVARMVELGMTPVLPAFPGFVPRAITRIYPNATVSSSSRWEGFPAEYTSDTFLDPFDSVYEDLQRKFLSKQKEAYGDVTHFYALDQFNENDPKSGDVDYLRNVSANTWKTLKAADPDAVWVMQAWLFYSSSSFWTIPRAEAYLGGVANDTDMLLLDLFSESQPQWQRMESYFGKPWIWCQLHDYGHNMGLYGQVENVTINAAAALASSSSMVGYGLSMEGQEGNEIMYDLLLDQAWSSTAIDTATYFKDWVAKRYEGVESKSSLYTAWEIVRTTVFNNTALASNAVPKAILELVPSTSGLINRTGHHPTTINYQAHTLVEAWNQLYSAGKEDPSLFSNPSYKYDLVDWTRQVLANAFIPAYQSLVSAFQNTTSTSAHCREARLRARGAKLTGLLEAMDDVLATNPNFNLATWIEAARATAQSGNDTIADFLEYEARNQVTLWGPSGQISDYASKSWAGLVEGYYKPRWQKFIDYLVESTPSTYSQASFVADLLSWEEKWANQTTPVNSGKSQDLQTVLATVVKKWEGVFSV